MVVGCIALALDIAEAVAGDILQEVGRTSVVAGVLLVHLVGLFEHSV